MISKYLTHEETKKYMTLPDEKLILAEREHILVLVPPILIVVLLIVTMSILIVSMGIFFHISLFSIIVSIILTFFTGLLWIVGSVSRWYGHFYIVTTRKILEIRSSPLFSHAMNDVFLDQVRATEVDVNINNFFADILDLGNVKIIFDRPSHDEVFIFRNIQNPKKVGELLGNTLKTIMHDMPVWFPPRDSETYLPIKQKQMRILWS